MLVWVMLGYGMIAALGVYCNKQRVSETTCRAMLQGALLPADALEVHRPVAFELFGNGILWLNTSLSCTTKCGSIGK